MNELDVLYSRLLQFGFVVLREASRAGDQDWIAAELEMLHNLPSLLGEENVERHRYYWCSERPQYVDWTAGPGREQARSRMQTYYAPIWHEMEPLVAELLQPHDAAKR